jgi:hypothetical protein
MDDFRIIAFPKKNLENAFIAKSKKYSRPFLASNQVIVSSHAS